jgi:hypothetical protein
MFRPLLLDPHFAQQWATSSSVMQRSNRAWNVYRFYMEKDVEL